MANPLRLRIIRELFDGPLTNSELAVRLDRDKATLLHHVRTLAATGFIEALAARRGPRGAREIPYRSTGKSWTLDVEDAPERQAVEDAMVAAFVEEYAAAAGLERPETSRLALRLSAVQRDELVDRAGALLREFHARSDEGGTPYAVFLSVHRRP